MTSECKVYVRSVDGTTCYVPVAARQNPDGTFLLLGNLDFDPEDTSTLFEYLPGDDVRAATHTFEGDLEPALLATDLVRSTTDDRDYWTVLFTIAWSEEPPTTFTAERLGKIRARVRSEVQTEARWHYPSVVQWSRTMP